MGLEEGGLPGGKVEKCPGDTFLARGRVHRQQSAVRQDCELLSIIYAGGNSAGGYHTFSPASAAERSESVI